MGVALLSVVACTSASKSDQINHRTLKYVGIPADDTVNNIPVAVPYDYGANTIATKHIIQPRTYPKSEPAVKILLASASASVADTMPFSQTKTYSEGMQDLRVDKAGNNSNLYANAEENGFRKDIFLDNRLIIQFAPGMSQADKELLYREHDMEKLAEIKTARAAIVNIDLSNYYKNFSDKELRKAHRQKGLTVSKKSDLYSLEKSIFPISKAIEVLKQDPRIVEAAPDFYIGSNTSNDEVNNINNEGVTTGAQQKKNIGTTLVAK